MYDNKNLLVCSDANIAIDILKSKKNHGINCFVVANRSLLGYTNITYSIRYAHNGFYEVRYQAHPVSPSLWRAPLSSEFATLKRGDCAFYLDLEKVNADWVDCRIVDFHTKLSLFWNRQSAKVFHVYKHPKDLQSFYELPINARQLVRSEGFKSLPDGIEHQYQFHRQLQSVFYKENA